jgi:hypothetical protein
VIVSQFDQALNLLNGYGELAEAVAASTQTFATDHIPFKVKVNNKRKPET